jgi:ribosome modulation factor
MPREMSQKAWQEGYDAGKRGERAAACPYRARTVESWSWSSGFVDGKAARANPASKANQDARVNEAVEILQAAYTPRATRADLVEAVGAALEALTDDEQAA